MQGDCYTSRKAIYDLFCEDEKGNQFIVQMQNKHILKIGQYFMLHFQ